MSLQVRYKAVLSRIKSNDVKLLAVSKKQTVQKVRKLYTLGHRMFGESYIQEAILKIEQLDGLNIQWHFIGPIQSNKTKYIAKYFDWVQSVDSVKLLIRLNRQREGHKKKLNILLQLKVGDENSKRGLSDQDLIEICSKVNDFENLVFRGLMSIPAPTSSYSQQCVQFIKCKTVFEKMQRIVFTADTLSMGMSSDIEAAIDCGTTMVRVGTDVFGLRD